MYHPRTPMDIPRLALSLVVIMFSVIFHEIMHGWVALKLGDTTARDDGRLTLNPVPHIDPWMTILFPILCLVTSGGSFVFGGAKPVRINALNFRNPGFGMMVSAAAGPLSNFFLAIVSFGLLLLLHSLSPSFVYDAGTQQLTYNGLFFGLMITLNLFLGAFNLIPIPPLDGSRVLRFFLPTGAKLAMDRMEPWGLFLLIPLILLGVLRPLLLPLYLALGLALKASFPAEFVEVFLKGL